MARQKKPGGTGTRPEKKPSILDGLKPEEAHGVLRRLLAAHPALGAEAEEIARSLLAEVSFEGVADEVEDALSALDLDDVHGRAGGHSWGYVGPDEVALELLEQAVDPFLEDMKRHIQRGLDAEALEMCKGIVLGLYRVRTAGDDHVVGWAPEFPAEHAGWTVDIWRAGGNERKAAATSTAGKRPAFPRDFVEQFVPEWTWLIEEKPSRR